MSEVTTPPPADAGTPQPEDPNQRGGDVKAKVQQATESLKAEIVQRLDQFLDEVGALI